MGHFEPVREALKALPVFGIIDSVVADVTAGKVTIVAASTGSGKSMMLPGALADALDALVVVLVPRRFLATDAAFNVAELSNSEIGDKVGYALGQMDGESSQRSPQTRVLYCTYGYALSSGLINRAQIIVLDEVHEADEYISLARAILRERKAKNPDLRILEMSATVNAAAQAGYWKSIAATAIHIVEARAMPCDVLHESPAQADNKGRSAEEIVVDLVLQNRKGVALFRPGVKEVENSVATVIKLLAAQNIADVETVGIHSGTPFHLKRAARRPPAPGKRKIIVGTNVIESGVNLRWLDCGVSDGYRKYPYHRDDTGAEALVPEDQPQAGILQQIGRVNRDPTATGFPRGLFVLHSRKDFNARLPQNGPAIQRQSLLSIAFYAACLGHDPTRLTWDIPSASHSAALPERLNHAKQELMRLQLLNADWSLTPEGLFIKNLPVSPETGALLWMAKHLDEWRMRERKAPRVMRDAVILAAIIESHGLRLESKKGHDSDQYKSSDLLDGMNAYRAIRKEPIAEEALKVTESLWLKASAEEQKRFEKQESELQEICKKKNASLYGFMEVARLADEITHRLSARDKGVRFDARDAEDKYNAERYGELQRCILNAHANRLFKFERDGFRDLLRDYGNGRSDAGKPFNGYAIANDSIVAAKDGMLLAGSLREMPVKQDRPEPLLIVTNATIIPPDIFIAWAADRAANHQPILSECVLLPEGSLQARYDGKAEFTVAVSPAMRIAAQNLSSAD